METKRKVAIIGTAGIPAKYGGFETLAENLTRLLGEDFDFTVYCCSIKYPQRRSHHNKAKLIYLPFGSNGKQSIIYDFVSMFHALFYADAMLILGVSGCFFLPAIRIFFRGKIIVNIDGVEWRRDKWRWYAKWFLRMSEAFAVWFSDIVVADHPIIQKYVKQAYGKDAEYIAYGADHVVRRPLSDEVLQKYPFLKEPYALSVCRIEPENNVHMILDAMIRPETIPFVIIGNWMANQYAQNLKKQYLQYKSVHMLDPIYDQAVLDQFRSNCTVYIHGHGVGGTNPALVEAMALGCPIVAYKVDYNEAVTDHSAKYFLTSEQLYHSIQNVDIDLLKQVGIKLNQVASAKYAWGEVSRKYRSLLE